MIGEIKENSLTALKSGTICKEVPEDKYSRMKYPKLLPLMRFNVDRWIIPGFGSIMMMHTTTKMGMELLTMSLMPGEGALLPYLLIDAMSMKKKHCVFIEYYGCDYDSLQTGPLAGVYKKYKTLPDYPEKDNWYVHERLPYSLIKRGNETELVEMTDAAFSAYISLMKEAPKDRTYRENLLNFRNRMITEGNPSSKTMEMLLKKEGAIRFMEEVIMPIRQ